MNQTCLESVIPICDRKVEGIHDADEHPVVMGTPVNTALVVEGETRKEAHEVDLPNRMVGERFPIGGQFVKPQL